MRKAITFIAVILVVTLGLYAGRSYRTPDDAALNCPTVQHYLRDGYTMDSCFGNAHRYLVPPTGIYEWGVVYIQLHRATGGEGSLETTYVNVKCFIQANDTKGKIKFRETHNDVTQNIVY